MIEKDYCSYVDVFYGNGETDRFFDDGLASKWFYIKALCGNTIPHATLPFGKMSVGAFTGGYPTGYGTHHPNSCGGIRKISDKPMVKGFSHLHQSGTGGIKYYYNYAVTTPFYGELSEISNGYPMENEYAVPGYYSVKIRDILCELTVDGGVALHRYTFGSDDGKIAINFANDGLDKIFSNRFYSQVESPSIKILANDTVAFTGLFSGIKLYFVAKLIGKDVKATLFSDCKEISGENADDLIAPYGIKFNFNDSSAILKVAYSTMSTISALNEIEGSTSNFDDAKKNAYKTWNDYLSAFKIETDDVDLRQKFYSNLYHSIVKPCDMTGENVLGLKEDVVTDFATFWDQYKTTLPLIYLCYDNMSEKIFKSIINLSRTLNKIPCSLGLTNIFGCEEQAKMLGILTLCDAYHMGVKGANLSDIEECVKRELAREDYKIFLDTGVFERFTHILDVTDACLDVAEITKDDELKQRLIDLAKNWKNAYGPDGLMSEKSEYYEGDKYTYSFRLQKNMEERIALAGGKEKFTKMLDDFFGFNGESLKQLTYLEAYKDIDCRHHRFEGFNNECDMETPYAYVYVDRHDRLSEIIHECVHRSFGLGTSGIPGNNDSGGLSSLFVFNALGIFPVSGTGTFLIGSPQIDRAEISLANKNKLNIIVNRNKKSEIYVDKVLFNGNEVKNYRLSTSDLMAGGTLEFFMK